MNWARVLNELDSLLVVCDCDNDKSDSLSKFYQVPSQNLEEVLRSDAKAIVIATTDEQHFRLAKLALEAGKHVLVEKPITLKASEAQELCAIAKQSNRQLMVGHLMQYHPAFIGLSNLVSKGHLGRLRHIHAERLVLNSSLVGESALLDLAPHDISMILSLAAELPKTVTRMGTSKTTSLIHMGFENALEAHVFVSWAHPYKQQKLVVQGESATAIFDNMLSWDRKLQIYYPGKADSIKIPIEPCEPLKVQCQHWLDCIRYGKNPKTDGLEGLQVLQVLESARNPYVD